MVNDRVDDPSEAERRLLRRTRAPRLGLADHSAMGLADGCRGNETAVSAGDIIFGRRRVYQRKLGVAHFDGICSAHAMVLRAKTEVAAAGVPAFLHAERFVHGAGEGDLVGSLSPTINWTDLAKEEFALPPLEEQRRLAERPRCVSDCDGVPDGTIKREADRLRRSLLLAIFRATPRFSRLLPSHWTSSAERRKRVGSTGAATALRSFGRAATCDRTFVVANVLTAGLISMTSRRCTLSRVRAAKFELLPGDILLERGSVD